MRPIKTEKTTGTYGAPPGLEHEIGGLPFYREPVEMDGGTAFAVCSVWEFTDTERAAIAAGANVLLKLLAEPIPPVSLRIVQGESARIAGVHRPDPSESIGSYHPIG
jgi:hypothetical protein